jgi:hypothetical protein
MTKLQGESGHDSIDERNTEAHHYIAELCSNTECFQAHERSFVLNMADQMNRGELVVSVKQLFWLRDLYNKYCL